MNFKEYLSENELDLYDASSPVREVLKKATSIYQKDYVKLSKLGGVEDDFKEEATERAFEYAQKNLKGLTVYDEHENHPPTKIKSVDGLWFLFKFSPKGQLDINITINKKEEFELVGDGHIGILKGK